MVGGLGRLTEAAHLERQIVNTALVWARHFGLLGHPISEELQQRARSLAEELQSEEHGAPVPLRGCRWLQISR